MKINLTLISLEEARLHPRSEYNPFEWKRKLSLYNDAQFYQDEKDVYVKYKIEEGLTIFTKVEYHSVLDNGGFRIVFFDLCNENFYSVTQAVTEKKHDGFKVDQTKTVAVIQGFGPNRDKYAENTPQNRKLFIESNTTITKL